MTDAGVRAFEMVAALDYERTAGSPQEAQAARSIVSALHSIGLSPHTQTFEIPLYQITRASFSVTSPASNALFFGVTGYGYSGNTPPEGLEAPFIYIENGEDSLLAQASGCIALLNIHPTPTLYHKMEAANVAGFVSISGAIDDDRRSTDLERRSLRIGRHVTSAEGGIPGLCIRAEDAARLLAAKPKRCKIILQQQTFFGQSANIIADIPGTGHSEETILFSAHYDSVPFSHGSYDNASGSAILLELCRFFKDNPLRRPCRFVWCGAEEIGLEGSRHYARSLSPDSLRQIVLNINIDLAGQLIGVNHAVVSAEESLCHILQFLAACPHTRFAGQKNNLYNGKG
uniref:M28 family peptidase n=1 Tax=Ruthenibacterium lactatiformans TaxID=1550024 RepID=UPI002664F8FC